MVVYTNICYQVYVYSSDDVTVFKQNVNVRSLLEEDICLKHYLHNNLTYMAEQEILGWVVVRFIKNKPPPYLWFSEISRKDGIICAVIDSRMFYSP